MSIDLHTHSTVSDGTCTPAELLAAAAAAGVDTLGLTDHDTTAGWSAAVSALPSGMTLLRGAEISCQFPVTAYSPRPVIMHLLAYGFDSEEPVLSRRLADVRTDRLVRARRMVELMQGGGLPITWEHVQRLAGGGTVGRPHLARALVELGVVGSVDAAFAGPVSSHSPYYLTKADIPVFEAVDLVSRAGGVSVFAHPLRRGRQVPDEGIAALRDAGLHGLEVDHPDHDAAARIRLRALAGDLGLVRTGASDFHGTNKTTPIAACTTARDQFDELVDPVRHTLRTG